MSTACDALRRLRAARGATWRVEVAEAADFLRELPADSADALVTDPPYSSGGQFRGDRARPTGEKYEQNELDRLDFAGDSKDVLVRGVAARGPAGGARAAPSPSSPTGASSRR